jgi:hypothetical protein
MALFAAKVTSSQPLISVLLGRNGIICRVPAAIAALKGIR